jgi:hypothetical protein
MTLHHVDMQTAGHGDIARVCIYGNIL